MRVIQASNGLHLTLKQTSGIITCCVIGIGRDFRTHHFDGYLPVYGHINSKIDLSHATTSQEMRKLISTDRLSFQSHSTTPIYRKQIFSRLRDTRGTSSIY